MEFSPDDTLIVIKGLGEQDLHVWDASSGQPLRSIPCFSQFSRAISFSPSGRRLCIAGDDGRIRLIDPVSGIVCYASPEPSDADHNFGMAGFTPDGQRLVGVSRNGMLTVMPAATPSDYRNGMGAIERILPLSSSTVQLPSDEALPSIRSN